MSPMLLRDRPPRRKRPAPLYRQLPDGGWQLEMRITDEAILARLEAASCEQGRLQLRWLKRR